MMEYRVAVEGDPSHAESKHQGKSSLQHPENPQTNLEHLPQQKKQEFAYHSNPPKAPPPQFNSQAEVDNDENVDSENVLADPSTHGMQRKHPLYVHSQSANNLHKISYSLNYQPSRGILKKAGDPSVIQNLSNVNFMPEKYQGKSKNTTINMLEGMMFNLNQLKVENYVKRQPKYLFKV